MTALLEEQKTKEKESNWGKFSFDTEITKVSRDKLGKTHILCVASDTMIDRQQDKMSLKALKRMESQLRGENVALLDSHDSTFPFGYSDYAKVQKVGDKTWELEIDFVLDDSYPQSASLTKAVTLGTPKFQLSIGGEINRENPDAVSIETDKESGRLVRVINDVTLDHVATTRPKKAANPRTRFMTAIIKSLSSIDDDSQFEKWHSPSLQKTDLSDNVISIIKAYSAEEDLKKQNLINSLEGNKEDESNFSEELMSKENLDNAQDEVNKSSDVELVLGTLEDMVAKGFTADQLSGVLGAKIKGIQESFSKLLNKSTDGEEDANNVEKNETTLSLNKETIDEIVKQVVVKMSELNDAVCDSVAEKMASSKGLGSISKSIDTVYREIKKDLGENSKVIEELKSRVEVVEKAGGVAQSVPVETETEEVSKSQKSESTFSGIWTTAALKACSEIKK